MFKCILISSLVFLSGYFTEKKDSIKIENEVSTKFSQRNDPVKVYLITWLCNGELSETQYYGEYDDVANKLRVEKELLDVKENPLYGTKGDLRGRYKFVAGSYYFNKN